MDMEDKLDAEVHVASRGGKWEVFFPYLDEALYSCEDKEEAITWANTLSLSGERDYKVVIE